MIDLQVIQVRDLLKVRRVTEAGITPRTLLLTGEDFSSAQEVYINESLSPDIVVSDSTHILAQVPTPHLQSRIRTVSVVSSRLTRTRSSTIKFLFGNIPNRASGIERLIQLFLKTMLQTPGTDIWVPNSGGGLLRAVGRAVGKNDHASVVADFQLSVTRARQQIMQLQASNPPTDLSERLLYARPIDVKFLPHELALVGKIDIANQAGKSAVVGLVT